MLLSIGWWEVAIPASARLPHQPRRPALTYVEVQMKRKLPYFTIYSTDFCAYTRHLTKAEIGTLVCAINDVALGYDKPKLSEKIEKIWKIFEERLIEDLEKYKSKIDRSQKGGAARGRQQAALKHSQPEPEPEPDKLDKSNLTPKAPKDYSDDFENLWLIYPRKDGSKKKAYESYKAAIRSGVGHARIESGVRAYADYVRAERMEQRYIAHATTWLNQGRWEADYSAKQAEPRKSGWIAEGDRIAAKYLAGEK